MNTEQPNTGPKAMVAVFEDKITAVEAVKALHEAGFQTEKMELVTHGMHEESSDVETPKVQETTESSMIDSAEKWSAFSLGTGATAGLLAAVLTGFPGIVIGMIIMRTGYIPSPIWSSKKTSFRFFHTDAASIGSGNVAEA